MRGRETKERDAPFDRKETGHRKDIRESEMQERGHEPIKDGRRCGISTEEGNSISAQPGDRRGDGEDMGQTEEETITIGKQEKEGEERRVERRWGNENDREKERT